MISPCMYSPPIFRKFRPECQTPAGIATMGGDWKLSPEMSETRKFLMDFRWFSCNNCFAVCCCCCCCCLLLLLCCAAAVCCFLLLLLLLVAAVAAGCCVVAAFAAACCCCCCCCLLFVAAAFGFLFAKFKQDFRFWSRPKQVNPTIFKNTL